MTTAVPAYQRAALLPAALWKDKKEGECSHKGDINTQSDHIFMPVSTFPSGQVHSGRNVRKDMKEITFSHNAAAL